MNRRRLSVEQWRDTILYLTGELDAAGGPSLELDDVKNLRRTVYARISRLKLNDLLMQMDYPDANVHAERRSITTTAIQKLFVLNSPWMLARAHALAMQTLNSSTVDRQRVVGLYQKLFNREPSAEELNLGLEFVQRSSAGRITRWDEYCQLLLASNEMLYVD